MILNRTPSPGEALGDFSDAPMPPVGTASGVYSVSQITRSVRMLLEGRFQSVWIEGEIANLTHHAGSGHLYFTLKDAEAALSCVLFRREASGLAFLPESGMKVLCHGRLSVYLARGQYQLVADLIRPCGIGELQIAFEQLKKKLEDEGLFAAERKRPLPFLPRTIGVITSPSGAVLHDILTVLEKRFPHVHVVIRPAQVQGAEAAGDIARAFEEFNAWGGAEVIILARGGGSIEDLWTFNEERVARAIAESRAPVISAIGHETDFTIADFVADLRAPTPSAAAETVLPDSRELKSHLRSLRKRLGQGLSAPVAHARERLARALQSRALSDPALLWEEPSRLLDDLTERLSAATARVADTRSADHRVLAGRLKALSPLECLRRGYAIVFDRATNAVIKSTSSAPSGRRIRVRVADGSFAARVEAENGDSDDQRSKV